MGLSLCFIIYKIVIINAAKHIWLLKGSSEIKLHAGKVQYDGNLSFSWKDLRG